MKKLLSTILVLALCASALCVPALAAEGDPADPGIYKLAVEADYIKVEEGDDSVTAVPQNSEGNPVTKTTVNISGEPTTFYANAEKLGITYSPSAEGKYYLVLALSGGSTTPTEDNLVYIDQTTAVGESTAFTVFPNKLTPGNYTIYMVSNTGGGFTNLTKVVTFSYYAPYTLGDVDNDGSFTATDSLCALQMSVGLNTWTDIQRLAANVDDDLFITATDALKILQRSVGIITSFDN